MKKYRFSFPKSAFVLFCMVILASVAGIVFAALRLAEVGGYLSLYPAIDIMSIVLFVLFVAFIAGNLFLSYYAFSSEEFIAVRLFSRKRVARDTICKFVLDEESSVAALYFVDPAAPETLSFVTLYLKKADVDRFIADLRAFRSDIAVEIVHIKKDEKE